MLVYANRFLLEPPGGAEQIIRIYSKWINHQVNASVNPLRLAEGISELRFKDGSSLTSRSVASVGKGSDAPYMFASRFTHQDKNVSGRRWILEFGQREELSEGKLECTILLRTDERSVRVRDPVRVTRPRLVEMLIKEASPSPLTPGLRVKRLDEDSARAFLHLVEHDNREHPICVTSCDKNGQPPIEAERLRSLLVGLADVVEIPNAVDTFAIEKVVSKRYIAYLGAINIIFPKRKGRTDSDCQTILIRPKEIEGLVAEDKSAESAVLEAITHRTNVTYSWRHISLEMVSQTILRTQLAGLLEKAREGDKSQELGEYIALLEAADRELKAKDADIVFLQNDFTELIAENTSLQSEIEGLKHALNSKQTGEEARDAEASAAFATLREPVNALLRDNLSLQHAQEIVSRLYAERIVILDTASRSAKESDRGGFQFGDKALTLLIKLADEYWVALHSGQADQHAKKAFGHKVYAVNEGQALSEDGRKRRTFMYKGKNILMEKHLRLGVKDSVAETLRIHFEWLAEEQKIIVGHCGRHLDF